MGTADTLADAMRTPLLALALALAVTTLGACSSSDDAGPTTTAGCAQAADGTVTLTAEDVAFDVDCIDASAGELTITLQNDDEGVNHNVHLPDLPGSPATELRAGPATDELDVTLTPGDHEFICDLHSNMVGTIHVPDANAENSTTG
jgi:plastocyanin